MAFSGLDLTRRETAPDAAEPVVEPASRLVSAARALTAESGTPNFTVQQVVSRSGTSLKTFYRHFAGKDELLLAVFAEDAHAGADLLEQWIADAADPLDRVGVFVAGMVELADAGSGYTSIYVREHLRFAESHPTELQAAVEPLVALLERSIREAVRTSDPRRDAVMVFHTVVAHIHGSVLEGHRIDPDTLWDFCRAGLVCRTAP
jgi:AcrR family transcriptional regulator